MDTVKRDYTANLMLGMAERLRNAAHDLEAFAAQLRVGSESGAALITRADDVVRAVIATWEGGGES